MQRIGMIIFLSLFSVNQTQAHLRINTDKREIIRKTHLKELLGQAHKRKVFKATHQKISSSIYKFLLKTLPTKHRGQAPKITKIIINQSLKYELDPMFLTAIIYNESSFNPHAKGSSGEIGLMQILPSTAKWMAKKINYQWKGITSLEMAKDNIIIGSSYLHYLRSKYKDAQLYMAAYNMGPTNLKRALNAKIRPKDYTLAVMKRYLELYKGIAKKTL